MKKNVRIIVSSVLVCLLVVSQLMSIVMAQSVPDTHEYFDIILAIDCSGTMRSNDPNDVARAGAMVAVDNLPVNSHARIGIIAFGQSWEKDENGRSTSGFKTYQFSHFTNTAGEGEFVTEAFPLTEIDGVNGDRVRESAKNAINKAYDFKGKETHTHIAPVLLAAEDMLEKGGATKRAIFFLTDGVDTFLWDRSMGNNYSSHCALAEQCYAYLNSANPQIPVYTIGLNYGTPRGSGSWNCANHVFDELSGKIEKGGYYPVSDVNDLTRVVTAAYQDLFGGIDSEPDETIDIYLDANGNGEYEFDIPELIAEEIINITGVGIKKVELYKKDSNGGWVEKTNSPNTKVRSTAWYWNFDLIRPQDGTWKVFIHGDSNAKVTFQPIFIREVELVLAATTNVTPQENGTYPKNTTIQLSANFVYGGESIGSESFYAKHPATLVVYCNGARQTKQLEHEVGNESYTYSLILDKQGEWLISAEVEDDQLFNIDGKKRSNEVSIVVAGSEDVFNAEFSVDDMTVHVGQTIDRVYFEGYANAFTEKDVDVSRISLTFLDEHNNAVTAENAFHTDEQKNIYMQFVAPLKMGTYTATIHAFDADGNFGAKTFVLSVLNDLPIADKEIRLGNLSLKDDDSATITFDLREYVSDPEGQSMTFEINSFDTEIIEISPIGGTIEADKPCVITVTSKNVGETRFNIAVSDEPEHGISISSKVKVVNWWTQNSKWIIHVAVGAAAACVGLLILKLRSRVKGSWQVHVIHNGRTIVEQQRIRKLSSTGMKTLNRNKVDINAVAKYAARQYGADDSQAADAANAAVAPGTYFLVAGLFGSASTKIKFKTKNYTNEHHTVSVNGGNLQNGSSSVKIARGQSIEFKDEDNLHSVTITMS